jgi:hypothetical protein
MHAKLVGVQEVSISEKYSVRNLGIVLVKSFTK